jgi:hypothetical protein
VWSDGGAVVPGTSGGTGYRNFARCSKCARRGWVEANREKGYALEATGRTRPRRGRLSGGARTTNREIEVRCLDCGHVGWTKHIDAERLLTRRAKE